MAMTSGLWTLNGLAVELDINRRALGKKLSDLKPDEEDQQAGRVVKRWRLARVLSHLKAAGGNGKAIEGDRLAGASYRADREKYTALHKKLAYEQALGELIPASEITGAWQQLVAAFRSRMLSLPSKLAPQLVAVNESRHIQTALTATIREALEELSRFSLPRTRGNGKTAEPRGPRRAVH